ncbi:MAG: hypothetical protein AAFO75_01490 [Pseudomonadota bacterium]
MRWYPDKQPESMFCARRVATALFVLAVGANTLTSEMTVAQETAKPASTVRVQAIAKPIHDRKPMDLVKAQPDDTRASRGIEANATPLLQNSRSLVKPADGLLAPPKTNVAAVDPDTVEPVKAAPKKVTRRATSTRTTKRSSYRKSASSRPRHSWNGMLYLGVE